MVKHWRLRLGAVVLLSGFLVFSKPLMAQAKVNIDKVMSSEDQRRTGVWRLSKTERQSLELWLLRWKEVSIEDSGQEQQRFVDWSAKFADDESQQRQNYPTSSTQGEHGDSVTGPARPHQKPGEGYGEAPRHMPSRYPLPMRKSNP